MKLIIRTFFSHWLEILMGSVIILMIDNIRWFLFYFFIVFLITTFKALDYIRKLCRVHQFYNEVKMLAIIRKLKITDEELSIVVDSEKMNMGEIKWNELEKETNDLR